MEDLDLSSCSFLSENFENENLKQASQAEIQNLTLQNERLNEVNNQLKSSVETLKNQLKDALEAVNSTNGFTDQIQALKQQLNDSVEANARLQEELKNVNRNGGDESVKLSQKIQQISQERDKALENLKQIQEQKNKLKNEKGVLKHNIEEQNLLLENLINENDKLKANKKKARAKMSDLSDRTSQLQAAYEEANNNLQKEADEKAQLEKELEAANSELEEVKKVVEEMKNQNESLKKELEEKTNGYSMIESQIEQQREEIDLAAQEKQKVITLLHKMSSALLTSETKIEALTKENATLTAKVQKQGKAATLFSRSDISDISIPYQGDLGEDCEKILKLPQYQPIQRVQLIINESAKCIAEKEDEAKELKKVADEATEKIKTAEETAQKSTQTLNALLKDLKELAISEQNIQKLAPCDEDSQFITFVTEKCAQLEPTIREKVLSDPHFISNDFFFSDDLEAKKKEIQLISEQSNTTFAILTAQFITNVILRHQLESLTVTAREISENQSQASAVKEECSKSSINQQQENQSIASANQISQDKYAKAVKVAKQMKVALKKAQQTQMELQKADSDQKTQIAQLQIQCDNYKNEIDVINMKLQVANNKLTAKAAEEIQPKIVELPKPVETRNVALEEELKQKKAECTKLTSQLRKAQAEFDQALLAKSKQYKKSEDSLKKEIISLNEQVEALLEQAQQKKKEQKKKDKSKDAQCEAKIKEINATLEDTKTNFNSTIDKLNAKIAESEASIQQLTSENSEAAKKNQEMQQENELLVAGQKKLQLEMNQMKQQVNKEKQHLQGQLSAQMMVYDTKLQQAIKEAREKAQSEYEELLQLAQQTLGSLYDLDDGEFTEETFKQLIELVKNDLDKLKYFQTETTKFTLEKKQ